MNLLERLLHLMFVGSQMAALGILWKKRWWRGAPAFMAFLTASCLQSVIASFGFPHPASDVWWWHTIWAPMELLVVAGAVSAAVEILVKRTSFGHSFERFCLRIWAPVVAVGLVGFSWSMGEYDTWFGWFVYAREFVWLGVAIVCGVVVTFFATPSRDRKPEPRSLVRHSWVFSILILSHSLIAPLARIGYDGPTCQKAFMAIMIMCCVAWITLCCPESGKVLSSDLSSGRTRNAPTPREKPFPAGSR